MSKLFEYMLDVGEEAVDPGDLVVGGVEEELQHVGLHQADSWGTEAWDETSR